ncbi:unnamed protein product [Paramecium sonneborni]|uniref:Uncharacterized protein n=1 Tax=Paramecium sonneborni TaxID=65129 RepID=A0A8S1RIB6_9CILI|nr:unnamed protein product [Paramecium sonneborni]
MDKLFRQQKQRCNSLLHNIKKQPSKFFPKQSDIHLRDIITLFLKIIQENKIPLEIVFEDELIMYVEDLLNNYLRIFKNSLALRSCIRD